MNRIRLLSEQVANQIAAGEVVERPASVVKELVENALDAYASRVTVEIQAGGRSLIRVTDDGIGMSRDDALLCLERHATSKIESAEDLSVIRTMGFRGEAVPSIASVSRMTLTTREREGEREAGTQVVIHGGRILEVKEAGSAPGTCVEVRNLFFNLPARRKFLRSEETERSHIQHYLSLAALAFPEVAFNFLEDQRVIWQLPQVRIEPGMGSQLSALKERLRGLYGGELKLLSVDRASPLDPSASEHDDPSPGVASVRVWGFIGAPGVSRATRDEQHLFVNRRPVENRGLNFALLEGYHTALMKGRFPVCCLFVEIDPAAVDVNIHPAKREVKFHQEHWVRRLVTQAVRESLLRSAESGLPSGEGGAESGVRNAELPITSAALGLRSADSTGTEARALTNTRSGVDTGPHGLPHVDRGTSMIEAAADGIELDGQEGLMAGTTENPRTDAPQSDLTAATVTPQRQPWPPELIPGPQSELPLPHSAQATPQSALPSLFGPSTPQSALRNPHSQGGEAEPLLQVPLRLLGVIGQLYVVLESDRGLVLMDQHAAHERILFEQMLRRLEQGNAPSQKLLLPETIELSPRDADFAREQLGCLTRLGVSLSEFGERTFLLDALPPFVHVSDARRFVIELVDSLKAVGEGVNSWRLAEHTVAKTVCRHAVKANDPLTVPELENLVKDLRQCAMPYTCPHGRPTLVEMNYRDLEKKFGRTQ